MSRFSFHGRLQASKSIMNRALILKSFQPEINLIGESQSEDVRLMERAIENLAQKKNVFECGEAGTVLRFLALRLSREPGEWYLKGRSRLLSRPWQGMDALLQGLGVRLDKDAQGFCIRSEGWKCPQTLIVDAEKSSQFASGLVLNAWNLPQDLHFTLTDHQVSSAYFQMTLDLVRQFGMKVHKISNIEYRIEKSVLPLVQDFQVEPDVSSCFALAACAALAGQTLIEDFPAKPLQPDGAFVSLLEKMGVPCRQDKGQLLVGEAEPLKPIQCDLTNTPDLFPVLAVLLSRADGTSRVKGIEHLVYKESDRLENTRKLLKKLGRKTHYENEILSIEGRPEGFTAGGDFDPDQDHRMAMAAQVANLGGANFHILHPEVVKKSFPEFWEIMERSCTP